MTAFPFAHRFRPAGDGDLGLIIDSWTQELRHAPSSRFVRDRDFFGPQRDLILDLLQTAEALVACAPDDAGHVYGYIIHGPGYVVHWCYVKESYRRIGLGDGLLAAAFPVRGLADAIYATHAGRMWAELEPTYSRRDAGRFRSAQAAPVGALTKRSVYYRPHLLVTPLSRAS